MAHSRSLPARAFWASLRLGAMFLIGFVLTLIVVAWPRWRSTRDAAVAMTRAHLRHDVSHPGWSFPGRVWSDAVPIEGTSRGR